MLVVGNAIRNDVGLRAAGGKGTERKKVGNDTASHPRHVMIVGVEHDGPVRWDAGKKARFRLDVIVHGGVKIRVVRGKIRKHTELKRDAVDSLLFDAM